MDTLRFYFVTWNVATKSPEQDLNSLLDFPSQFNKNKPLPDVYVLGLQEVKSQPQDMLRDALFSDQWTSAFNKILCRNGYILAKTMRLQGLLLLLYTHRKHISHLKDIEGQYTRTGLGGLWGNKGAVSIRFNIYGCSVCLVNCHLSAHEGALLNRVNEYNSIIKQHEYHVVDTVNILYHDYVFWIGDLNFRTDYPSGTSPTTEEIIKALHVVEKNKYTKLLKHDELLAVMQSGEAFSEFKEPEIQFPPTYKFSTAGDDYDLKRKPSWTDRILYKVIPNNYENVTLRADNLSYEHFPHYVVSDHKPVAAVYTVKIVQRFIHSVVAETPRATRASIRMHSAIVMPTTNEDGTEAQAGTSAVQQDGNVSGSFADGLTTPTILMTEAEAFSNYTVKSVEFAPISRIWYIGDADFRTQCTLSQDVEVYSNDWIGIFDADFHSLDDYIVYEYLAKLSLSQAPGEAGHPRTITLSFPVGSGVRTPGFYRFIYFSQPTTEVRSVLGISEPFEVSSKEEKLVTIDPCDQPSSSTSPSQPKPTTATTDIFTDFTGLDVAKLSRHFANDLSID